MTRNPGARLQALLHLCLGVGPGAARGVLHVAPIAARAHLVKVGDVVDVVVHPVHSLHDKVQQSIHFFLVGGIKRWIFQVLAPPVPTAPTVPVPEVSVCGRVEFRGGSAYKCLDAGIRKQVLAQLCPALLSLGNELGVLHHPREPSHSCGYVQIPPPPWHMRRLVYAVAKSKIEVPRGSNRKLPSQLVRFLGHEHRGQQRVSVVGELYRNQEVVHEGGHVQKPSVPASRVQPVHPVQRRLHVIHPLADVLDMLWQNLVSSRVGDGKKDLGEVGCEQRFSILRRVDVVYLDNIAAGDVSRGCVLVPADPHSAVVSLDFFSNVVQTPVVSRVAHWVQRVVRNEQLHVLEPGGVSACLPVQVEQ
mmetsp:Transcript_15783/g.30249  ORF Transcript_15783/g.30249 Transcript_15783/m.30249 type:complete len:361 (-) Transcript_15783:674-1756(-)